jgi:hypothetical protein
LLGLTHIGADGEVAGVLVHAGGGLADARVGDEFDLGSGGSMLENGKVLAIALDEGPFVLGGCMWESGHERAADGKAGAENFRPHCIVNCVLPSNDDKQQKEQ